MVQRPRETRSSHHSSLPLPRLFRDLLSATSEDVEVCTESEWSAFPVASSSKLCSFDRALKVLEEPRAQHDSVELFWADFIWGWDDLRQVYRQATAVPSSTR